MFGKKKQPPPPPQGQAAPSQDQYEEALSWEASRLLAIEQSERRAWLVALSAVAACVLSWLAIVLMMPLKKTEPYVIRVDSATGVPDIVTTLKAEDAAFDEVVQKYFLAKYVRARETYDWYTLQTDYDTTRLLSSAAVGVDYAALFDGEEALDKRFGAQVRATVQIQSVVPTGERTGTVRFLKRIRRVDDPGPGLESRWVATVAFTFNDPASLKESERLVNPFGFQITSYRVDPELGGGAQ
jgi:type IV secretion system protein VirB8